MGCQWTKSSFQQHLSVCISVVAHFRTIVITHREEIPHWREVQENLGALGEILNSAVCDSTFDGISAKVFAKNSKFLANSQDLFVKAPQSNELRTKYVEHLQQVVTNAMTWAHFYKDDFMLQDLQVLLLSLTPLNAT